MSLCMLSQKFTPRTQEDMMDIFRKFKDVGYSSRMSFLRDAGLHFVKNTFWKINNSSSYDAYSYDLLHTFDAREWGKHLWPLVLEAKLYSLTSMRWIPRWHGLKHFYSVAGMDFADGNSFRDILKCIIPCIVQLLPSNASLVHCIRFCTILRSIAGLRVVTSDQIDAYKKFLIKYEKWCKKVTKNHRKTFNYPKHHNLIHLPEDVENKGCTENYSTRPGEEFQQEVQQAYKQINFKDTGSQITRIDENQEAIMRIRMFVNIYDTEINRFMNAEVLTDGCEPPPKPAISQGNYALGSPLKRLSIDILENTKGNLRAYCSFGRKLQEFLGNKLDEENRPSVFLTITHYQCLYLKYLSMEDWREKIDILRYNPSFHNRPRYDCVVINTNPITFAHLKFIFTCEDSSNRQCDVTFVRMLKNPDDDQGQNGKAFPPQRGVLVLWATKRPTPEMPEDIPYTRGRRSSLVEVLNLSPEQSSDRVHRRQLSRRGRIPERAGAHPKIPVLWTAPDCSNFITTIDIAKHIMLMFDSDPDVRVQLFVDLRWLVGGPDTDADEQTAHSTVWTTAVESTAVKLSQKEPSTPTLLVTCQEARRRVAVTVPPITARREPVGSTTLPPSSPPPDSLIDSDSEDDSPTTELHTQAFPSTTSTTSTRSITTFTSSMMANTDRRPLAEVRTGKMKDCPILTPGCIDPQVIQTWTLACKRYMKHAEKKPSEIVSFVAKAMQEPQLIAWYQVGQERIDTLPLKEYLEELSKRVLKQDWAPKLRDQVLSSQQGNQAFMDWKIEVENLNAILLTSAPVHTLKPDALKNQIKVNLNMELKLNLHNEPVLATDDLQAWSFEVDEQDQRIRTETEHMQRLIEINNQNQSAKRTEQ
ncbi:hypothetical protein M422DRAFT_243526 [Sphaerobolus stellatus SS14]|nr:hypothetical protein M422DRAFT_243526 [Sphaerobolus stellatus SS14]